MTFNPDLSQKPQEVISRISSRVDHPVVTFNNSSVGRTPCQKDLRSYLNKKLSFSHHIKEKISKACEGIGVIKKLHYFLPRHSLLTMYKSFIRLHVDYGDIIYDQPNNQASGDNIEVVQHNISHYWSYSRYIKGKCLSGTRTSITKNSKVVYTPMLFLHNKNLWSLIIPF